MYQQQMQLQMQMQQHFSTDSTDSSHIPFGQPGYPQPSSAVGFMQNGTPLLYDEKEHQSNSMSISSLSGMPPPLNQNSLYQSYQISSLPESKRQQMKRHVEPLNGNIHPVGSLNRMKSSDTSVSAMSSFFGSHNSSMFSQEQLLSLNEQQSLSMQGMPIEALRDDLQRNNSHDQTGSTQDRRRMFRQNFSQQSTFNLPLAKDDQDTSGTSTSDLMRESLLSFNQSGPIQSPSHDRRFSTGDMTMSEFSLNRILETAEGNSASFLSFGTVGMPSESRFQLGSNIIPTIDISNQPGPESYPQNTVTSNAREVYFNSDVNFESKRGLQEDASMISQSRRSSVSTWLGEVEKFPGLRTIDMGSFRNDAGGSRLRLFSGQSYANESMRSIMSDLSENISALDLAHEHGFPQRRRSSQSTHIFQMT
jgi:DNA-binding transcriptional MerR regulator